MGLRHIAILVITFCVYSSESRGLNQESINPNIISLLLNDPNIRLNILEAILQNQGTSVDQIEGVIENSGGDINQAINGVNSAVREDLLNLQDGSVQVNPEAVRNIVRSTIQTSIRQKLNDSALAAELESSLDALIANAEISEVSVPVDDVKVLRRKRRDANPIGDVASSITDAVLGLIQNSLGGVLGGLLDNLINILKGFLIPVAPGNAISDLLAGAVNFVVKTLIDLIAVIKQTVSPTVASRRKRAADTTLAPTDENETGGLLGGLIRPVLQLLASALTPVNHMVKSIVGAMGDMLTPILGTLLIKKINNVVLPLIDLLIPANPI